MSTTLLQRLFPASEHSSLQMTLRAAESFEKDLASSHKRRRLSSDEVESISKRRATSLPEVNKAIYKPDLALQTPNNKTPLHYTRDWALSLPLQRKFTGQLQIPQNSHRSGSLDLNGIKPRLLHNHPSRTDLNKRAERPKLQVSHVAISGEMKSKPTSYSESTSTTKGLHESGDYHLALAAISDQVLNGVRITSSERDLLQDLIALSPSSFPEVKEEEWLPGLSMPDLVADPVVSVFPGFVIKADTSEEEDDSSSDFSNFFDLDEASEERSPADCSE